MSLDKGRKQILITGTDSGLGKYLSEKVNCIKTDRSNLHVV